MAKRLAAVKPWLDKNCGGTWNCYIPTMSVPVARYRADQNLIRAAKKYANGSTDDYEFLNAIAAHDKALGK